MGIYIDLDNFKENSKATDKQVGGSHYKDKKLQPWDIIDELNLNFYEGNALKYLIRYKDKNGVEDLKKAIHYIEKLIQDLESQKFIYERFKLKE